MVEFHALYGGGREIFVEEEGQVGTCTERTVLPKGNGQFTACGSAFPLWVTVSEETPPRSIGNRKDNPAAWPVVVVGRGLELIWMPIPGGMHRRHDRRPLLGGKIWRCRQQHRWGSQM